VIGISTRIRFNPARINAAKERAERRFLFRGSAFVRTAAKRSIRRRKDRSKHSPPGTPPFTHTGRLRNAVRFAVDARRGRSVIGPSRSIVGRSGGAHEQGGRFKGDSFDRRPFMAPTLDKTQERLRELWRDSVR